MKWLSLLLLSSHESPVVKSPQDPVVTVTATTGIAELVNAAPSHANWLGSRTGNGGVVARAWSEPPANGAVEKFCLFDVAVNPHDAPAFVNLSLSGTSPFGIPADTTATTPLQRAPTRELRLHGQGDQIYIVDVLGGGEKAVYQIGCHTTPWPSGCGDSDSIPTGCGIINPDFEDFGEDLNKPL